MISRWSPADEAAFLAQHGERVGQDLARRAYTARLIGAEPDLVLHGGGNTSVKSVRRDLLGNAVPVLYVKASGRDLATIAAEDHTSLDLAYLQKLRALDRLTDDQMIHALRTRMLDPDQGMPSLEALVHAFIPAKFIDHTHADAILALTNQSDGKGLVREVLGEDVIILDYILPGFDLARAAADAIEAHPGRRGMVLMHHGLITWGEDARESYEATIDLVTRAEEFVRGRARATVRPSAMTTIEQARERLATVAPILRGLLAERTDSPDHPYRRAILAPLINRETLDSVDDPRSRALALSPPLTTDHLIRTKALPLWVDEPAYADAGALRGQLSKAIETYCFAYGDYLKRHSDRMDGKIAPFDSLPRVVLMPGLGALCAGADARAAGIARDITSHTLSVKAAIAAMGTYEGLSEDHLFDMEYRGLQHAKLVAPSPLPLRGHIALVTGAAGAIGSGICRELLEQGCHVAATDLSGDRLDALLADLEPAFPERVRTFAIDVADGDSVATGFREIACAWGGIDLVVVNAGIAHAAPLAEVDLEAFRRLERVNTEGTLLLLREAARHFAAQTTGGDIVLVSTKNVFAPGAGFGAYSATKAAAHQLARIASLELAPLDVRVNMVAPDAVFSEGSRRSGLWKEIGPARMRARGLDEKGLEEYYRDRNLLKARVTARHVARAVLFFATRQTPTTGATIPVDGGLPDATPR